MKKLKKVIFVALSMLIVQSVFAEDVAKKPNFIVFLVDDLGYNDAGVFGSKTIKTPNLDSMASEGIHFTSAYVGAPFCGPSRAALMTGSYPIRIGEVGNKKHLHSELHTDEITIAEVLKTVDYKTALIGKWHVGHKNDNHPLDQGFDSFFGVLEHNGITLEVDQAKYKVPLEEGRQVLEILSQERMNELTTIYTQKAVEFIKANKESPFFLFLSHNMPHVSLGVSEKFKGKSGVDLYSDVVMELDWSMGQIRKTLEEEGLAENTFVVFFSDNGPWQRKGFEGNFGCADPLKGSKGMSWEGGHRIPMIMEYKGVIPAGQSTDEMMFSMDILPTFAKLAGATLPADLKIDGVDIMPMATGEVKQSPHEYYYYYAFTNLFAIRDARYKLVLPRKAKMKHMGWWGNFVDTINAPILYDLKEDIGETKNVIKEHPEVVERLMAQMDLARKDLGDAFILGEGVRSHEKDIPAEARLDYGVKASSKSAAAKKSSKKKKK